MARTSDQLRRLQQRMDAIPREVRQVVQPALDKSAQELAARQRSLAPRDDGDLQASIRVEPGDHELARKVLAGDDRAFYARFVEFGTLEAEAQPFFYPAYRLLKKRLSGRIKRAISKSVKERWRK